VRGRLAAGLLVAVVAALLLPGSALAHAVLVDSSPAANARLARSPAQVTISFNEEVQLLKPTDLDVVDRTGAEVSAGPGAALPSDARVLRVALRPDLPNGTYTVRYLIVSADSHVVGGYFVFGVGPGELAAPYLGGSGQSGPSETSVWAVSARFLELIGLGGLFGLLVVRWLVWRPAWRGMPTLPGDGAERLLTWERDAYWTAFGILAVGAMLAEGYLLVVKSASALGVSVVSVARDPGEVSTVLSTTHFGDLIQLRGALLFALFAIGAWRFIAESAPRAGATPARPAGSLAPAVAMGILSVAAIALVSVQGHASQAPLHLMQVTVDVVHLGSVSIWIAGLAWVLVALRRLPRVADGGEILAARALAQFSRVAFVVVSLAIASGVVRAAGELSDPAQLWDTSYGRSIIYKLLLLCPIAVLALRNRRVVTSLRRVTVPTGATLRMVRRNVAMELTLTIAVVVVASVLVAQVPGRV
jgi:copper transport protein